MGNFNNRLSEIKGNYGTYKLLKLLGRGGNGEVFEIDVVDCEEELPKLEDGYVIKILYNMSSKRIKRFINEIQTVYKIQNDIDGIIPIYDFCKSQELNSDDVAWYVMPKAKPYNSEDFSDKEKLLQMLDICNTLVALHKNKICHRDIKPDNLLFYNDRLCISDFGLVCEASGVEHITGKDEKLGPKGLRPPEFNNEIERANCHDYRKSDVYLFAKTLWMVLKNKNTAFSGSYDRDVVDVYLNSSDFNIGKTLEPLHNLFEKATQYYPTERESMLFCSEMIYTQIDVAEETINIYPLMFNEAINNCDKQIVADDKVFRDKRKIEEALSKMKGYSNLIICDHSEKVDIGKLKYVNHFEKNIFKKP